MVEISELPDSLRDLKSANLREVSQLKYVVEMVDRLCPNVGFMDYGRHFFQGGTCIFLKRYFDGCIDTSYKSAYQNHIDLQNTLEVYGIDPTAYWYLILFLKDYVDDESTGEKSVSNAYTDLFNFASKLKEMDFSESPIDGEYQGCKNEGFLKFKVGKHWFEIKNDKALYGLFCALCSYLNKVQPKHRVELIDDVWEEINLWETEIDKEHLFTVSSGEKGEVISIPETYRISYFTRYMRMFLKPFRTQNTNWRISNDKWLLISRVIYIIGYSTDDKYNTRKKSDKVTDLDYLKGNYQKNKYKDLIKRTVYV